MLVKEIMSKKPDFLSPSATLMEASKEMLKRDIGFLPIGENDRLIGALTDRDIAIRGVAAGKDPLKTKVKEIITDKVLYCYEDDDIKKALKSMEQQQVRRLIVLNSKKRMTGILSVGDVARNCEDESLIGHAIQEVSEKRH